MLRNFHLWLQSLILNFIDFFYPPFKKMIDKQIEEVNRSSYYEKLKLPAELDYMKVTALSIEVRQKLSAQRPETLGLASRISGITPAAVSLLLVHLKKSGYKLGSKNQKIDTPEAQSTSKDLV